MTLPSTAASMRFGRFELQPHERRLLIDGRATTLGARAFDLLLVLAERAGRLVDKGTLLDLVWPGLVVQENNLATQMSTLRKLLGEGVIATIPGRGYRFIARLEAAAAEPATAELAVPAAPALPRQPSLRTNLPAELPPLVGRESELAELARLIDGQRLVSVVGAGGIGKSLLTQHALALRREAYAHGVCWVELAALADPAALAGAVAAALGVHGGQGDPLASLVSAVSSLTMLLALDNAEHLLDAVAVLARALLDATPGLRIVVTSQAPLRLTGEQLLRVEPLAVPELAIGAAADNSLTAEQALNFGAVALFAERAQAVDRRFAVTDANVGSVVQICRALDGLPLAIELAAARAPLLGLPRLLQGMQHRLALLTQGRNRDAPPRQRTLRAALEWSHELLAPREQRAFRRLAVVAGSASLELVLALLVDEDDAENGRWEALDALDQLVERSLVALASDEAGAEPRYRMLETPRAYALEALDRCGERQALQRVHAHAVAALFDAAYADYFDGRIGADDWLRRLEHDLDNARDALHWARGAGDAALQLRIGSTMLRALPPSLHVERVALADACQACIGPAVPEPLQLQTWIELSCGLADAQKLRARQAAEHALALARRLDPGRGDRFGLYHALARAASAAAQTEDMPAARVRLAELLPLEDPAWPAQRRLWGAEAAQWVARMGGQTETALHIGRRLLALDRERGGHASIATGNLIDAELAAGNVADAAQLGAQLVASLRGTRHEYSLAFARINLLAALLALDDVAQALPVARAAWSMAGAFELQHAAAAYLSLLAALQGRAAAAVTLAAYSEAIYAERGEVREQNETAATQRALALVREALDAAEFEHCRNTGALLRDAQVEALAFGAV